MQHMAQTSFIFLNVVGYNREFKLSGCNYSLAIDLI